MRSSTLTKHPATSKTDSVTFTLESLTGVEALANTDKSTGKKYKSNFIIKYDKTLEMSLKSRNSK